MSNRGGPQKPPPPFDLSNPLEQIPGESDEANTALREYAMLGPGRSLRVLYQRYRERAQSSTDPLPPTKSIATIKTWSANYGWVARVKAWKSVKDKQDEVDWDKRRAASRERAWEDAEKLHELFQQILELGPSFLKRRVTPGEPTIVDESGKVIKQGKPTLITVALGIGEGVQMRKLIEQLAGSAIGETEEEVQTVINQYFGNIDPTTQL